MRRAVAGHAHLPMQQIRWREGVYYQICRCGYYRTVDALALDGNVTATWRKRELTARNWRRHARAVLELMEWSGKKGGYNVCPVCQSMGPHKEKCILDRLLHEETSFRDNDD